MAAGSAIALLMSFIAFGLNSNFDALGLLVHLETTQVVVTSIWAWCLFGKHTRRLNGGLWRAMISGIVCVMLTIATFAFYDAFKFCLRLNTYCLHTLTLFSTAWSEISLALFGTLFLGFLPQLMGVFGGAMIWLLTRGERA